MTMAILRFNFAAPQDDPARRRDRIQAALELSSWSETRGVSAVSFDEHHQSGHGWSCNPIMTAAVLLARTEHVIASVDCALGPLWHPVRLAEDIALVDTIGGGRLIVTTRAGLPARRIRVVRNAVRGPRSPDGRPPRDADVAVVVRRLHPRPAHAPAPDGVRRRQRPRHRAAGRQVRPTAQPAQPPARTRRLLPRTVCRGRAPPSRRHAAARSRGMVFLHEDPDRAWAELGEHYLWEARVYSGWGGGEVHSFMHGTETIETVDDVKAAGRYRFMSPEQLIADVQGESGRSRSPAPARRRDADRGGVEVGPAADR